MGIRATRTLWFRLVERLRARSTTGPGTFDWGAAERLDQSPRIQSNGAELRHTPPLTRRAYYSILHGLLPLCIDEGAVVGDADPAAKGRPNVVRLRVGTEALAEAYLSRLHRRSCSFVPPTPDNKLIQGATAIPLPAELGFDSTGAHLRQQTEMQIAMERKLEESVVKALGRQLKLPIPEFRALRARVRGELTPGPGDTAENRLVYYVLCVDLYHPDEPDSMWGLVLRALRGIPQVYVVRLMGTEDDAEGEQARFVRPVREILEGGEPNGGKQ